MNDLKFPWVLFNIAGSIYGISSEKILSIIILHEITNLPKAPDYIRGVINLRGKIIPFIDLRKKLDLKSVPEEIMEFEEMLARRNQDHIHWLDELENSVKENREFKLTTDPHACAFGKWFDLFQTDDIVLNSLLRKVDRTHKYIHSIAVRIKTHQEHHEYSEAEQILASTKDTELKLLINLFSGMVDAYRESRREIGLVLENKEMTVGVITDEVVAVEKLKKEDFYVADTLDADQNIYIGKRKDNSLVMILDDDFFFKSASFDSVHLQGQTPNGV
jgi:chemotaxis signal transduction protein